MVGLLFGDLGGFRVTTVERYPETKSYDKNIRVHTTADSVYRRAIAASDMGSDITFTPFLLNPSTITRTKADALYTRAIWLDLDVRPGNPAAFQTDLEAWDTLWSFCQTYNFPPPSLIVSTGGGRGFHLYWLFSSYITPAQYETLGVRLRSLLVFAGKQYAKLMKLSQDTTRVADAASLMRIPGTYNTATGTVASVVYGKEGTVVYGYADFDTHTANLVTSYKVPYVTNSSDRSRPLQADANVPTVKVTHFDMMHTCGLMSFAKQHQSSVTEPAWRAVVGMGNFIKGGEVWARDMSNQHPDFSEDEMLAKMENWKGNGPPTCSTLATLFSGFCDSYTACDACKYKKWLDTVPGKSVADSSPLNVWQMYKSGAADRDIQIDAVEEVNPTAANMTQALATSVATTAEVERIGLNTAISILLNNAEALRMEAKGMMELVNGQITLNAMPITAGMVWVSDVFHVEDDRGTHAIAVLNVAHSSQVKDMASRKSVDVRTARVDMDSLSTPAKLSNRLNALKAGAMASRGATAMATLLSLFVTEFYTRNPDSQESQPNVPYYDPDRNVFFLYGHVICKNSVGETTVTRNGLYEYMQDTSPKLADMMRSRLPNARANRVLHRQVWDSYQNVSPLVRILMYAPTAAYWQPLNPEDSSKGMWVHLMGMAGTGKTTLMQVAHSPVMRGNAMIFGSSGSHAARRSLIRAGGSSPLLMDEVAGLSPLDIQELGYAVSSGILADKATSDGSIRSSGFYTPTEGRGSLSLLTTSNNSLSRVLHASDLPPAQIGALTSRFIDIELSQSDRPELSDEYIRGPVADLIEREYGIMLLPVITAMLDGADKVTARIAKWADRMRYSVNALAPGTYASYRVVGATLAACLAACEYMAELGLTSDNPEALLPYATNYIVDKWRVAEITTGPVMLSVGEVDHGGLSRRITSFISAMYEKGAILKADYTHNQRVERPDAPIGRYLYSPSGGGVIGAVLSADALIRHMCRYEPGGVTKQALMAAFGQMAASGFYVRLRDGKRLTSMENLHPDSQPVECFSFEFLQPSATPSGNVVNFANFNPSVNNSVSTIDSQSPTGYSRPTR